MELIVHLLETKFVFFSQTSVFGCNIFVTSTSTTTIKQKPQPWYSTKKWQASKKYISHKYTAESIENCIGLVYVWFTSNISCIHSELNELVTISQNHSWTLKFLFWHLPPQPLSYVIVKCLRTESIKEWWPSWGRFALFLIFWCNLRRICSNSVKEKSSTHHFTQAIWEPDGFPHAARLLLSDVDNWSSAHLCPDITECPSPSFCSVDYTRAFFFLIPVGMKPSFKRHLVLAICKLIC